VTLADERNFSRAAERLNIAQPPLSRQIQQLETELGALLLDRGARPLRLTQAGQLLNDQARALLGRADDIRAMIDRLKLTEKKRFAVGFVASTIYARLPALIREFRAAAPHIDLVLVEMVSLDQIRALKDGRIDLGFGRVRFHDEAVRRTVLREEALVAAIPSGHTCARRDDILSLAELADEPLILYPSAPRPSYADQVLALFHDQGLQPRIGHEVRELQIALGLVAAEEGVCIIPESVQKTQLDDVCYRRLDPRAVSPIIMSHRANDSSEEIALMGRIIARMYQAWNYTVPEGLRRYGTEA
jgi:DNA-binding transcriptional LysR family regulator